MNREEILQKSREENKGMDVAEMEASRHDTAWAAVIAIVVATALYMVELIVRDNTNPALYVVILGIGATMVTRKALRKKDRTTIICAVLTAVSLVMFLAAFIIKLVKA